MQELRQRLQNEGKGENITMKNMMTIAGSKWQELSDEERKRYNQLAKSQKHKVRMLADDEKYDNQGNLIANRVDSDMEDKMRRQVNRQLDFSHWPSVEDIMERKFYWISFQTLCELDDGHSWLPCEVALVEWSMKDGITNTYHKFIDPGPIPLGYRYTCQSRSDDTHQIPIEGFELADSDYESIYREIEYFVNPELDPDNYPPIYSLHTADGKEWRCSEYCMNWLYTNARSQKPNFLHKIYCLEDMVMQLYELAEQPISESSAIKLLTATTWDYEKNTRCDYHEKLQVKDCALAVCKRFAFALSDALNNVYDFELTERHILTQDENTPAYTLITPSNLERRFLRNRATYNTPDRSAPSDTSQAHDSETQGDETFFRMQPSSGIWSKPAQQTPAHETRWAPASEARRAPVSEARQTPVSEARRAPVSEARWAPASEARQTPVSEVRWAPVSEARRAPVSEARQTPVGGALSYSSFEQPSAHWGCRKPAPSGRGFVPQGSTLVGAQANVTSQFLSDLPRSDVITQSDIDDQQWEPQKRHQQQQQQQSHQITNNEAAAHCSGIGRARGRGQPRRAAGGPGMTAPPTVTTRAPLHIGLGFSESAS